MDTYFQNNLQIQIESRNVMIKMYLQHKQNMFCTFFPFVWTHRNHGDCFLSCTASGASSSAATALWPVECRDRWAPLNWACSINNLWDVDTVCRHSDTPGDALILPAEKTASCLISAQKVCFSSGHEKGVCVPASFKWESNSLIFPKPKAAHFKVVGSAENHTTSQQQNKRRGNLSPSFLLGSDCSGSFSRKTGQKDGGRAGTGMRDCSGCGSVISADQSVSLSAGCWSYSGPGQHPCGKQVIGIMGKLLSAFLHCGFIIHWPCFIYVIRILNGCN